MQSGFSKKQIFFYILIKSWNTYGYLETCINSVLGQTFKNYKILFVDDASDFTKTQKENIKQKLKGHIYRFNRVRKYAVNNTYTMINEFADYRDSVVVNLDGDDWLIKNNALQKFAETYSRPLNPPLLTYGDCLIWDGKKYNRRSPKFSYPLSNTKYPGTIERKSLYRQVPFRVFHTMTFRTDLFKKINEADFKEDDGTWLKYCPDLASYLPMLEMANGKYSVLKESLYAYNVETSKSNLKKNLYNFIREPIIIRKKKKYDPVA